MKKIKNFLKKIFFLSSISIYKSQYTKSTLWQNSNIGIKVSIPQFCKLYLKMWNLTKDYVEITKTSCNAFLIHDIQVWYSLVYNSRTSTVTSESSPSWLSTVSLRSLNCIAMIVLGEVSKVISHCLLYHFPFSSPTVLVVNKKLDPSLSAINP